MALLASLLFSLNLASAGPLTDQPLPLEFDQDRWRQIYLEIALGEPYNPVEFFNLPEANSNQAQFIKYFQSTVEPKNREVQDWLARYYGLKLLLDSGLAREDEELQSWKKVLDENLAKLGALDADPAYKAMVLELGRLATGLSGNMASQARLAAERIELTSFAPEYQPKVIEMYQLDEEIDQVANDLPAKDRAIQADQELNQLLNSFYKGEVSFQEAAQKMEVLSLESSSKVGQQLIERAGDKLQRLAALKSELAKSKGFQTWADYAIATQAEAHAPGLKSKDELLKFLYGLLDETETVARRAYDVGARKHGMTLSELRPAAQYLLLPPADFHLYGYFPKRNIERLCRETMRESGFPEALTRRVMVDAFPRPGKQGHAYMMPARTSSIRHVKVDGTALEIQVPNVNGPEWTLPVTAIVQNFSDDDVSNARTMFHENGHGLEYASQRLEVDFPRSYGYAETHSTTMESFLEDREFLLNKAVNSAGEKATPEIVDRYLKEKAIANLMGFRANVAQAIFDIELWNYDYTAPQAQKLWERATEVNARLRKLSRFNPLPEDLVVPMGMANFRTGHFYSGSVRYFGYVLAEVSAGIVHEHLLDQLELRTGRRSLYNQPAIAEIITPLYRDGLRQQFPTSIESFTGKAFSPKEFAKGLNESAKKALGPDCRLVLAEKYESRP